MTPIWIFLILIILAIAVAIILVFKPQNSQADRPGRQSVFNLKVGEIVQYRSVDWVVAGILTYTENGLDWIEYLLQDGDRIGWLSVEEDDTIDITLQRPAPDLYLQSSPATEIRYKNIDYHLIESGTASMTRKGNTLQRQSETCRYFEFAGPNQKVLSVEDWDGDWEVTYGERIEIKDLILLPRED